MKDKKKWIGLPNASRGIIAVAKSEWNFRFHLIAMLTVIVFGFLFRLSPFEWVAIIIVIGLVLITEIINTAIEKIIDYVKPEFHPIAGFIKDAAAGAVLISAIVSVIVGMLIFLPKIF
ncbi:diacylglycerol kinase family protein [Oceanobacillus sp. CAU 1775]